MGSFNDILYKINPDMSYPSQKDLKNIHNKVTSNMEEQESQKQAYPSFSLKYIPGQTMF